MLRMILVLLLLVLHLSLSLEEPSIDPNGYVMFCPCMGRFGNQAEQFLGAMGFTHRLNRTLVLPHWIEYPTRTATSVQIPFDRYFQVAPLQKYLRVILMEEFMDKLASKVWPKGKRFVFCYMAQEDDKNEKQTCKAKEGNPFGPYWNKFHIDFDGDVFYKPLYFDIPSAEPWNTKFPPAEYPVFAFSGPPSGFPTEQSNIRLAKYLVYSDYIREKANKFLNQHGIQAANLLALHIRNGVDFERACSYAQPGTNFFASAQCLGYDMNKGVELTKEVCYPSEVTLLRQTEKKVKEVQPKVIYIASDGESLLSKFQKRLEKKYQLKVIQYSRPTTQSEGEAAHMDLYILSVAEHAIVNCPSSFSAFAKRQRDRLNKSTDFWGIPNAQYKREMNSDL